MFELGPKSVPVPRFDRSKRCEQQEFFEDKIFKRIVRPETNSQSYTSTVQADREYRSGFRTLKTFCYHKTSVESFKGNKKVSD